MRGYKIMRYDSARRRMISLANARLSWPIDVGVWIEPPPPGLFLSPNRQYVIDYYGSGGAAEGADEVLLTFEFDPREITSGNLADREPEIAVRRARLIDFEVL